MPTSSSFASFRSAGIAPPAPAASLVKVTYLRPKLLSASKPCSRQDYLVAATSPSPTTTRCKLALYGCCALANDARRRPGLERITSDRHGQYRRVLHRLSWAVS